MLQSSSSHFWIGKDASGNISVPRGLRSFTLLTSFIFYCIEHPDERFWQALRNWSGYHFIHASDSPAIYYKQFRDTYYWEGKRHDD